MLSRSILNTFLLGCVPDFANDMMIGQKTRYLEQSQSAACQTTATPEGWAAHSKLFHIEELMGHILEDPAAAGAAKDEHCGAA